MKRGTAGLGEFVTHLSAQQALAAKVGDYVGRLSRLLGVTDVDLHVEEVTGTDNDFADATTREQKAVFDLAWPNGIQEELSQPVAVLINESNETLALASQSGFRCFTTMEDFRKYVEAEILAGESFTAVSTSGWMNATAPRAAT
jgi:hypothetical protein